MSSCASAPHNYQPEAGYVPDAATARKIAEAVWTPIYGKRDPGMGKPYEVILKDNVWTVEGVNTLPPGMEGGSAIIEISKMDGRILRVSHGM